MQPQVAMIARPVTKPRIESWTSISPRLGNEPSNFRFTTNFFAWWRRQLVVIEDFPYVGVYSKGSDELVLLEGIQWDTSGTKKIITLQHIFLFCLLYGFGCETRDINHFFHHVDIGAAGPMEMPALGHHGDA